MRRSSAWRGARRRLMFKNDLLKDRGIFLSGGGSGLGRSMALHFATLGAKMFIIGRRDTVINNAAGNFMARTEKLSPNAFDTVVSIVLNGSFHCTQAFARKWIAQKKPGNVLSITTTYAAANCGSGFVVPSSCAKAGVLAMTTSLAVEWAKYTISLNAIAPGPFPTEGAWSR